MVWLLEILLLLLPVPGGGGASPAIKYWGDQPNFNANTRFTMYNLAQIDLKFCNGIRNILLISPNYVVASRRVRSTAASTVQFPQNPNHEEKRRVRRDRQMRPPKAMYYNREFKRLCAQGCRNCILKVAKPSSNYRKLSNCLKPQLWSKS